MVATVSVSGLGRAGVSLRFAVLVGGKSLGPAAMVRFQHCQCCGFERFCAGPLLDAPIALGVGGIAAQFAIWLVLSALEHRGGNYPTYLVQRWLFYAVSIRRLKISLL